MQKVNIAVIGCGFIGQRHLNALAANPRARLVAVCDAREDVARSSSENHDIPRWTTQAADLFRDPEVDAVVLAMPTAFRRELAREALRHGKHLLVEKPAAMNAAEVEDLISLQGDRVAACCSSRMSLFGTTRAAREFVAAGGLGEIRVIHCRAVLGIGEAPEHPRPAWRLQRDLNGGGILVNWGCYDLDFLFSILGWSMEPVTVMGQTWTIAPEVAHHVAPGSDAETHAVAMVRFADGSVFHYDRGEFTSTISQESWQIVGSRATLRLHLYEAKAEVILDEADPYKGVTTRVLYHNPESRDAMDANPTIDFVEAILERKKPNTGLKESLLVARITDGIYESAETGRCVILGSED